MSNLACRAPGAMAVSAASTLVVFALVEPLDLGLHGVWAGLAMLQLGRLATLAWRYQSADGPLPPLYLSDQLRDGQRSDAEGTD